MVRLSHEDAVSMSMLWRTLPLINCQGIDRFYVNEKGIVKRVLTNLIILLEYIKRVIAKQCWCPKDFFIHLLC